MTVLVFDFDGTLTNIHEKWDESVQLINVILSKYNIRTFTSDELKVLRGMQTKEMIAALNIPFYKAPFLLPRIFSEIRHIFPNPIPYTPLIEELPMLKTLVSTQGILTSNSYEVVESFLDKHYLHSMFDFVVSNKNVFGKHRSLAALLKKYTDQTSELWYVGDEVRDVEACHKAKVNVIGVTWGISSKEALVQAGATVTVDSPYQITEILRSLKT